MLQKVSKNNTWKISTLQPEMENWERKKVQAEFQNSWFVRKPLIDEQPSWTHKGTHSRESHEKWDRTATGMQKFSQEREKAKGFASNEQKGEKLSTQKIQNIRLSKLHPWCSPAKWYRLVQTLYSIKSWRRVGRSLLGKILEEKVTIIFQTIRL